MPSDNSYKAMYEAGREAGRLEERAACAEVAREIGKNLPGPPRWGKHERGFYLAISLIRKAIEARTLAHEPEGE